MLLTNERGQLILKGFEIEEQKTTICPFCFAHVVWGASVCRGCHAVLDLPVCLRELGIAVHHLRDGLADDDEVHDARLLHVVEVIGVTMLTQTG